MNDVSDNATAQPEQPQAPERFKCANCEEIIDSHIAPTHIQGKHPEVLTASNICICICHIQGGNADKIPHITTCVHCEQAQPLEGEIIEKHAGGRPTKFNDEILTKTRSYYQRHVNPKDGKVTIPYVQELAIILDISRETMNQWEENIPEFSDTIKRIKNLQELRLLQRTLSKNPTGAIFQLKANHGMMETDKQILQGSPQNPINLSITDDQLKRLVQN